MEEMEIKKIIEKFKINFLQVEKLLAQCDERINTVEERVKMAKKEGGSNELKNEVNEIKKNLKPYEKINAKTADLEKNLQESKEFNKKAIGEMKQNFSDNAKELKSIFTGQLNKVESRQIEFENKFSGKNKRNAEEQDRRVNKLLNEKEKEFNEIEEFVRERIERAESLSSKLPDIEKISEDIDKKFEKLKIFMKELRRDKNVYMELRKVVLASIERLRNFETLFSDNIEEFAEINKRVEESENLYDKLYDETKKELLIIKDNSNRIEQNAEEFKKDLKESLTKKFNELDTKLEEEVTEKLKKQDSLISHYGNISANLEKDMKNVKTNIIPEEIDNEVNSLLQILNSKMKDLVSVKEFEIIHAELRDKVEQIRKPEIEPLEKRILEMEEDINEMKDLLRGLSQRLPVIVE